MRALDRLVGVPLVGLLAPLLNRRPPGDLRPKKILIIKLAAMGDLILLVPPLRALRRALPDARIEFLASRINGPVAVTIPYVDRVRLWDPPSPRTLLSVAASLRRERFDVVIDAEQWARATSLLTLLSGAPLRIGFDTPGEHRSGAYNRTVRKNFDRHEVDDFFDLFSLVAPLERDRTLELWETPEGRADADRLLPAQKPTGERWILFHPGCGSDGKPREWPIENYAVLANWLLQRGARLFLSGGPEEAGKTSRLNRLIGGRAIDLGGRLSWPATISMVKRMDGVVSGNTGVMHVAAALGRPQIALHGPTNPVLWGPINPNAEIVSTPCPDCPSLKLGFEYHRGDDACMRQIDLDTVKQAASRLIDRGGRI